MIKQAYILCGGKGSRLANLTKKTPKPLLKIRNHSILHYIINELVLIGIMEIKLITHYLHYKFDQFVEEENNRFKGTNIFITKIIEEEPLGTAGKIIEDCANINQNILVINGDSIFKADEYLKYYINNFNSNYHSFIRTKYSREVKRFGILDICNDTNLIKNIYEKDITKKKGHINTGLYLFNIKDLIKFKNNADINNRSISFEYDVFPFLIKSGRLKSLKSLNSSFLDIGVIEDYKISEDYLKKNLSRSFIFVDRDNTLNEDKGYTHKLKDLKIIKKNIELIKSLKQQLTVIIVISNQSGIARKLYDQEELCKFNKALANKLKKEGLDILGFYFCPHHPEITGPCECRKPKIGLFKKVEMDWLVDKDSSIFIGDSDSDIIAGEKFGLGTIRVYN